jgi:hypothetical protein
LKSGKSGGRRGDGICASIAIVVLLRTMGSNTVLCKA